ncbi:hypothetical protein Gpo141_00013449, partial [Globisporangium polare]
MADERGLVGGDGPRWTAEAAADAAGSLGTAVVDARSDRRFSCAFTRRNCAHDPLFSDQYKRTNRTKGTKIMRCFPHCCPQHVERSYCGAPVYLQVDFEYSAAAAPPLTGSGGRTGAADDEELIHGEKLQVF